MAQASLNPFARIATECPYYPGHDHEHTDNSEDYGAEPGTYSECPYEISHTDWDEEHPRLGDIHRGMGVTLPHELHQHVHDESAPVHERAAALLGHLQGNHLGNHWSADAERPAHYVSLEMHDSRREQHSTGVVLHAHKPAREHIETDPETLDDDRVIGLDKHEDREVPLQHHAPVHVKGISWTADGDHWNHHSLDEPQQHIAVDHGAGLLDFVLKGLIPDPSKYETRSMNFDYCRFRRNRTCWYSGQLDHNASAQMGYAVWIPVSRGICNRDLIADQRACPISEPGPHSGEFIQYLDATIPYSQGGQRGGHTSVVHISARRTAMNGPDELPQEIGKTPIPEDHVRLFHHTWAKNIPSIREHGLLAERGKGDSGKGYGQEESAGVWGSTRHGPPEPEGDRHVVEFHVHPSEIAVNGPYPGSDHHEWNQGDHNVLLKGSVKPENISAIHDPWHTAYHQMSELRMREETLKGYYDNIGEDPQYVHSYGKAIEHIKREGSLHTAADVHRNADGTPHSGIMIALPIHHDVAKKLAVEGGEKPEDHHVTVAFLGKKDSIDKDKLRTVMAGFTKEAPPLKGKISGFGNFEIDPEANDGHTHVHVGLVDIPGIGKWRQLLMDHLSKHDIHVTDTHGIQPHISLKYGHEPMDFGLKGGQDLDFSHVISAHGSDWEHLPLNGSGNMARAAADEHLTNPTDGTKEWHHGTPHTFEKFDEERPEDDEDWDEAPDPNDNPHWNTHLGQHWTSLKSVAKTFARGKYGPDEGRGDGSVHTAHLGIHNPKHYASEFHMDKEALDHSWGQDDYGHDPYDEHAKHCKDDNCYGLDDHHGDEVDDKVRERYGEHDGAAHWLTTHPDSADMARNFKRHLEKQGHDGVVYGNEIEGPKRHACAITFDDKQIHPVRRTPWREAALHEAVGVNEDGHLVNRRSADWHHGSAKEMTPGAEREQTESPGEVPSHWNTHLGQHWASDHRVAKEFARGATGTEPGTLYTANLGIKKPKKYQSEYTMDDEALDDAWDHHAPHDPMGGKERGGMHGVFCKDEHCSGLGAHPPGDKVNQQVKSAYSWPKTGISMQWLSSHPESKAIAGEFKAKLQAKGYDGITYGNQIEGPKGNKCAITFDPSQVHNLRQRSVEGLAKEAAWRDVRSKAVRIRSEGGVDITQLPTVADPWIVAKVVGDTGVYISRITRIGNTLADHTCDCRWGDWVWDRDKYYGRPCSHVYALYLQVQSAVMFGRELRTGALKTAAHVEPFVAQDDKGTKHRIIEVHPEGQALTDAGEIVTNLSHPDFDWHSGLDFDPAIEDSLSVQGERSAPPVDWSHLSAQRPQAEGYGLDDSLSNDAGLPEHTAVADPDPDYHEQIATPEEITHAHQMGDPRRVGPDFLEHSEEAVPHHPDDLQAQTRAPYADAHEFIQHSKPYPRINPDPGLWRRTNELHTAEEHPGFWLTVDRGIEGWGGFEHLNALATVGQGVDTLNDETDPEPNSHPSPRVPTVEDPLPDVTSSWHLASWDHIETLHTEPEPALPWTDGATGDENDHAHLGGGAPNPTPAELAALTEHQDNPADTGWASGPAMPEFTHVPNPANGDSMSAFASAMAPGAPDGLPEGVEPPAWLMGASRGDRGNQCPVRGDSDIARMAESFLKLGQAAFSVAEQEELISEHAGGARASNLDALSIAGTHYADILDDDDESFFD